jgi:hypothetical protein
MHILTGMHRSGTSLAARLLQEAGADLGNPAGLVPADRWNPDGYFEPRDVMAINRRLLHGLFGRFAYFRLPSEETMRRRARRLTLEIRAVGRRYKGKLAKDPRFTLTTPVWEENGLEIEKFLICLREPVEVAVSLRRRNWVTRRMGLRLWEEHHRRLLRHIEGRPVWWIRYSRLVDPIQGIDELAGAARHLGLSFDDSHGAEWVHGIVRMRPGQPQEPPPGYLPAVENLWAELCARHARQMEQ